MSCVWMTSDWHLGHANVAKWRGFDNVEEHDYTLIENCAKLVTKRDIIWFLGDMLLGPDYIPMFRALPGHKRLVLGNHDTDRFAKRAGLSVIDLACIFEEVHGMVKYKKSWLTHAPIHPDELRGKINIHGHTHSHRIQDERYVNVCPEQTDFKPVKYQEILRRLSGE